MSAQPTLLDIPVPRRHRRVRDTSVASYAVAREKLKGRQADVLRWLAWFWNARQDSPTSAELADVIRTQRDMPDDAWVRYEHANVFTLFVRRGLSDLQTHGLVQTLEKRKCAVTGSVCRTWRVKSR